MGFIYKITNLQNKKCYIGQTIDYEMRIKGHMKKNSNCLYLKNALKKYGKNKFKFEVVCICFDEDMNKYEIEYIKKFKSLVPNGYNLKAGGNSGARHHEETKKKISESLKGREGTFKGKKHTKESKNKMSKIHKGRKLSKEHIRRINETHFSKKVSKYDLDGKFIKIFNSVKEAAMDVHTSKAGISQVCNGKRKTHKGFVWKFM